VAEKNFYGTFIIPYVVVVALASAAGFYVLASFVRRSIAISAGLVLILLLSIYGAPLFVGDSYRSPYNIASPVNRVISALPSGYTTMVSRIERSGGAPTLSLPLLQTSWTYLVGQEENGKIDTYIGIPPLYFLNAVEDYTGTSSFGTPSLASFQINVQKSVVSRNAQAFARVTEMLGIRWVLVDLSVVHQADFQSLDAEPSVTAALSFSHSVEGDLRAVVVAKDGRYSLLAVRAIDTSSVISIDENDRFSRSRDGISRVASGKYRGPLQRSCPNVSGGSSIAIASEVSASINGKVAAGECFVALRVPHSNQWSAELIENGRTIPLSNQMRYGFANGFVLPAMSPGSIKIVFTNSYSRIDDFGIVISISAFAALLLVSTVEIVRRRRIQDRKGSTLVEEDKS
jgi:hypothetical protein